MCLCGLLRKNRVTNPRNLACKQGWNRISHLVVLLRAIALKEVVVGEGLQTRSFADSQAAALARIRVDVVVAIFLDVGHNGR